MAGTSDGYLKGMATLLLLTAGITGTLATVHDSTTHRIEANRRQALWSLAEDMVGDPGLHLEHRLPTSCRPLQLVDGRRLAWITSEGYGGTIDMLVLQSSTGTIEMLRTVRHAETPGIGDFISGDTSWMRQFQGREPDELDSIDGRTGATITANAVVRGVHSLSVSPPLESRASQHAHSPTPEAPVPGSHLGDAQVNEEQGPCGTH